MRPLATLGFHLIHSRAHMASKTDIWEFFGRFPYGSYGRRSVELATPNSFGVFHLNVHIGKSLSRNPMENKKVMHF